MIQTKLITQRSGTNGHRFIDRELNRWLEENPSIQVMDMKFTTIMDHINDYVDSVLIVYETGDE